MGDTLPENEVRCGKCCELRPLSEFYKRNSKLGRRSRCRTCEAVARAVWYRNNHDLTKTDFRHSPHVNSPDLFLRYHLCDPVQGELIATTATMEEAREAAIDYHDKRRVRIKFVEIYDEETLKVYHLTRPTKRHARGVMRGPCAPSLPDESLRVTRGPDKVPRGPRITISTNTMTGG